jgi:hypothetical protein
MTSMLTPQSLRLKAAGQVRSVSTSPYGRTHVWKYRRPMMPNPVVPRFPQLVIRADGSSFTHWTTSPRSILKLTRDLTNNPVWNTSQWLDDQGVEDEASTTGRLGRFNRKFAGIGGGKKGEAAVEWMQGVKEDEWQGQLVDSKEWVVKKVKKKGGKKK